MNNITEIELSKLVHHPQNPRKDLGDLTELTDSIKASGIMQNLTVVPEDDHYLVVIGNRRMEAAKLAGLDTAPCAVVDMTPAEQISTMMVENMQRSDLTIFEQAAGFQLMMDMGDSLDDISEKTGFSKSTVRRRVKLMELDQDELKKVADDGRQISMSDLDELNKVEDVARRNGLLKDIGTANFHTRCLGALEAEKIEKLRPKLLKLLKDKGVKDKGNNVTGRSYIGYISFSNETHFRNTLDSMFEKYKDRLPLTVCGAYGGNEKDSTGVYLYCTNTDKSLENQDEQLRRKRFDHSYEVVKNINHKWWLSRLTFIRNYTQMEAKRHISVITAALAESAIRDDDWVMGKIDVALLMGYSDKSDKEKVIAEAAVRAEKTPNLMALWVAYGMLSDCYDDDGYIGRDYQGKPERCYEADCEQLDRIYDFLEKLGYEMSDEEKALRDGTSELFDPDNDIWLLEEDIRDGYSDYFNVHSSVYQTEESRKPIPIDAIAKNDVRVFNALRRAGITDSDKLLEAAENGSLFKLFKIAGSKYGWLRARALALGIVLPYKPGDDGSDEPSGDDDEEE